VVELLTLLLRIREVSDSNLGLKPGYLTEVFRDFAQSIKANAMIVP
jgi:hypothetical protein